MENGTLDQREDMHRAQQEKRGAALAGGLAGLPQNTFVEGKPQDCAKGEREPLIYELRRKTYRAQVEAAKSTRALELLEKHPEFEELIELLRLVPIY